MFITDGVAQTFKRFEPLEAYKLDLIGSALGIVGVAVLSFLGMPPVAWGVVAGGILIVVSLPKVRRRHRAGRRRRGASCSASSRAPATPGGRRTTRSSSDRRPQRRLQRQGQRGAPPGHAARRRQPALRLELRAGHAPRATTCSSSAPAAATTSPPRCRTAPPTSTPSRSTASSTSWAGTATPTGPTRTSGSTCTSTTGGPSSSGPTTSGTASCSPCPTRSRSSPARRRCGSRATCSPTEAIESARDHLTEGGVFSMYNYYREGWLVDRYANTLDAGVRAGPCVETLSPGGEDDISHLAVLTVSEDPDAITCDGRAPGPVGARRPTPPSRRPTTTRSRTCARTRCPGSTS